MPTLALILTVFVDVVIPGRGLVTGQDWHGEILRNCEFAGPVPGSGPYIVRCTSCQECTRVAESSIGGRETDTGQVIARAKSYHEGAVRLAFHHGHPKAGLRVDVQHERDLRLL